MDLFTITAVIVVLSALFGYINVRFLKLPNAIGLMVVAILFTAVLFAISYFSHEPLVWASTRPNPNRECELVAVQPFG